VTLQIDRAAFDKLRLRKIGVRHRQSMPDSPCPHPEPVEGRRLPLQRLLLAIALLFVTSAARAETIAVLQGLDKTTARVSRFDAPIDKSVRFGTLVITARACIKRPPEDPPESAAFLEIDEVRPGDATSVVSRRVFSGWMFASSPAVSALEDPIYDVNVLDCKADATAAPSSGSAGK
jgi:hypothetical protein